MLTHGGGVGATNATPIAPSPSASPRCSAFPSAALARTWAVLPPPVSCREDNVAIEQCRRFAGDVLIVESEKDEIVPVVASCLASLVAARSVTYRVIAGADQR